MSDILKHTKGIIEIYHRLVPDTSQTLRAVSSRAMAEIEEVELKFAALQAEAELHRVAHRGTLDELAALEAARAVNDSTLLWWVQDDGIFCMGCECEQGNAHELGCKVGELAAALAAHPGKPAGAGKAGEG